MIKSKLMKRLYTLTLLPLVLLSSCSEASFESTLVNQSTFTNRIANYSEIITFIGGNNYSFTSKYKSIEQSGTFEEVFDYEYEYYVKGEVLSHEVHKRNDHIKVYSLNGLSVDDKQVYFIYNNEKRDNGAYSYYKVNLFNTNEQITSSLLETFRKPLENVVVLAKGEVDTDWELSHYVKGKDYRPIESVTLNQNSFDIGVDETVRIEATINPKLPTDQYYEWEVDDEEIVSIESTGTSNNHDTNMQYCDIKGLKKGTANVHFLCGDGKSVTIPVTVRNINVESISITIPVSSGDPKTHPNTPNTFYTNFPFFLNAQVNPEEALFDTIVWENDNNAIFSQFSVSSDKGKSLSINAKAEGDVTITARIGDVTGSITLHFINYES